MSGKTKHLSRDAELKKFRAEIAEVETEIKKVEAARDDGRVCVPGHLARLKAIRKKLDSEMSAPRVTMGDAAVSKVIADAAAEKRARSTKRLKYDKDGHIKPSSAALAWVENSHGGLWDAEKIRLAQAKTLMGDDS